MSTRYYLVSWADPSNPKSGTREYGTTTTKQAAIRRADKVLPPGTEYVITTLHSTVAEGVAGTHDRKEAQ